MPEISNVNPSEVIASDWGNDVRDRVLQRYDDKSTRASEASAPEAGELSYLQDSGDIDVFHAAAWRHVGVPSGTMILWPGATAPMGWILCQGQSLSRTTYADLFNVLSTTYGSEDGSSFNLPDLRQRLPLGKADSGTGDTLGATGGSINHVHSTPNHTHTNPNTSTTGNHAHSLGNTGSGGSHNHSLSPGFAQLSWFDHELRFRRKDVGLWTTSHSTSGSSVDDYPTPPAVSAGTTAPAIDLGGDTASDGAHTHSTPNTNTTGNHAHTQGSTGSANGGNTGSSNPPFIALNYAIKI